MGSEHHYYRDTINTQCGVHRFSEQGFAGTLQELFGATESPALAGGEEDDGGMEDMHGYDQVLMRFLKSGGRMQKMGCTMYETEWNPAITNDSS